MYKISLIENGTKQNEITIADIVELFQFVEFSSQCYIDIDYDVVIKIEEC